jgi:predicted dehydrogenase
VAGVAPLRWGIVGTGRIARSFVSDLEHTDSGRAVAVGSRAQHTARAFAEVTGIGRQHASYQALVEDPEVDAVYVATPHPMHLEPALAAIAAGKAVLVEKAFTMNGADARRLVQAARDAGVFLMEGMWTRFLPHVAEIRRLVAAGDLGEVLSVTADHGQWFPAEPTSRLFARDLGGGALLDLGVYPVSFASMILGRPDRVTALVGPAFSGVDAQTSMLLGHAGGAHAVLTCTSLAVTPTRAAITGTEGRIEVDRRFYAPTSFTFFPRQGDPWRYEQPHPAVGLYHEADEVARCVAAGELESPLMPLDETVSILDTMDAVLAQASPGPGLSGR